MLLRQAAYFFGPMPYLRGNSPLTGSRRESSISAAGVDPQRRPFSRPAQMFKKRSPEAAGVCSNA